MENICVGGQCESSTKRMQDGTTYVQSEADTNDLTQSIFDTKWHTRGLGKFSKVSKRDDVLFSLPVYTEHLVVLVQPGYLIRV